MSHFVGIGSECPACTSLYEFTKLPRLSRSRPVESGIEATWLKWRLFEIAGLEHEDALLLQDWDGTACDLWELKKKKKML